MVDAEVLGHLPLELAHVGAVDEGARRHDGGDAGGHLVGDFGVLPGEVDEGDRVGLTSVVVVVDIGQLLLSCQWFELLIAAAAAGDVPSGVAGRRRRAGAPTHTLAGGTSWRTTEPMPISDQSPTVVPSRMTTADPT